MAVAVVRVGIVGMGVRDALVPVRMHWGSRPARREIVRVTVMRVVGVRVGVGGPRARARARGAR